MSQKEKDEVLIAQNFGDVFSAHAIRDLDARTALLVWCSAASIAGAYFPRHLAAVVGELGPDLGRVPHEGERGRIAPYSLALGDMAFEAWHRSDAEVRLWELAYGWCGPSPRGCVVRSLATDGQIVYANVPYVGDGRLNPPDAPVAPPVLAYDEALLWRTSVCTEVRCGDPHRQNGWEVTISPHHVSRVAAAETTLAVLRARVTMTAPYDHPENECTDTCHYGDDHD